jgi:DNA-binding GntR family transcriptional regulator
MQEHYQVRPHQSLDSFVTGIADMEETKLFYIENGAPVMRHQRIDLDSEGKPTEFTQSIFRSD